MALPDVNVNPSDKSTAESHRNEKKEKPPTKVIVRRLPPGITQESFINQVSPLPDYDYMYTVKGDMSLGENSFSRVYISFVNVEDIYLFKEKFDNYVFVDSKGHEYTAVVEFASFQKIPKKRGKQRPDPKLGSIESDATYLEFIESLKQQPNQEEKPEFSYQPGTDNKNDVSTPLLEYLKQRKIDKLKSREEKREERRRKEIERKKMREEERKRRFDEKSPVKSISIKANASAAENAEKSDVKTRENEEKLEKVDEKTGKSALYKSKDRKYEDYRSANAKPKLKYPNRSEKYESYDKKDYKNRRDDYKDKDRRGRNFDDYRKEDYRKEVDTKQYQKKVKKYSERREEWKTEARKAEQKKEVASNKSDDVKDSKDKEGDEHAKIGKAKSESGSFDRSNSEDRKSNASTKDDHPKMSEKENSRDGYKSDDQDRDRFKNKENDPRTQRRIRNKDRPTMAIYQPGMLSKRKQVDDDKDPKETTPAKE